MKFNVGDMVACIDIGNNWYGYIFRITVIDTKSNDSSYLCENVVQMVLRFGSLGKVLLL